MDNEDIAKAAVVESVKVVAKEAYRDAAKPLLSTLGGILALPLKFVDAALNPIKMWIDKRNNNYERVKNALAEKLKGVDQNKIVTPDSYVAVPALQQLAYSYDSEELREMYANLLASAMNEDVKESVHPSYADIIKQLSPIDAKALEYMKNEDYFPIVDIRLKNKETRNFNEIIHDYCLELKDIYKNIKLMASSLQNLQRLGLVNIRYDQVLKPDTIYDKFKEDDLYKEYEKKFANEKWEVITNNGYIELTNFGKEFCNICCNKE